MSEVDIYILKIVIDFLKKVSMQGKREKKTEDKLLELGYR